MASSCARRTLASTFPSFSRRLHPSFSHLLPTASADDDLQPTPPRRPQSPRPPLPPSRPFPVAWHRERWSLGPSSPVGVDMLLRRYSSSSVGGGGGEEVENLKDSADAFVGNCAEAAAESAKALGEVAAAAADSAPPVAALQHLVDAVHSYTGLNWWAAIAVTTLCIRFATVPLLINQMRATSKLSALKPELEELKGKLQNTKDPQVMQENQRKVKELFKKHGVSPFSPMKGIFIQGPIFISFYLAISNMVEKVPSLREGGALWFTDLTTPDPFYAFPILTGLTFLVTVELNMQDGMEGNPMAGNMKKFSRLLAFLTVPFTASFPKAIFCYWMTSNLFSLIYGAVLKHPPMRKFLNLPEIAKQPSVAAQPSLPFLSGQKQVSASSSPLVTPRPEPSQVRVSSSVIQRIQTLEKAVKGKKTKRKRKSR